MSHPRSNAIIEARGLGRSYGGRRVLYGINLDVARGQVFALVGADGAGKTTLLQMLAAILDPSEGQCRVMGFDTKREASAITSRIGYMAQGFTLYDRLTVAENISFSADVRGLSGHEYTERRQRLLQMAGLTQFIDRREGQLSGGMRKKLALCTNLVHQPRLLLLDEPSLGVDPLSRNELWKMLREFQREGTTIVFSTSYMEEAESCDRVAFLDQGKLIVVAAPGELRSKATGAVFLLNTDRPADAYNVLQLHPLVIGTQWRSGGVRFQLRSAEGLPAELAGKLEPLGKVGPAEPTIEDAFVILREPGLEPASALLATGAAQTGTRAITRPAPANPIIARGLTRRFGTFLAVDNVSLKVRSGEVLGLLGPNGAGKTTLVKLLCGLLSPSEGEARVAGLDPGRDPRGVRSKIGYMSQKFSLYPDLTVGENMRFFARAHGMPRDSAQAAVSWAAAMTGLEGYEHERVQNLSGAVRQRLALGCSVLHRPTVLFLDEPTSGVDPLSRYRFWHLVNELAGQGTTIIVTTHYLAEAAYCHRLGLMHEGRLIALGDLTTLQAALGEAVSDDIEDVFIAYIKKASTPANRPPAEEVRA